MFLKVCAFLAFSIFSGCFATTFWMVGTLHSPRGMSGYIYLVSFVFVTSEIFVVAMNWYLVLKPGSALAETSNRKACSDLKSSSEKPESKSFQMSTKDAEEFITSNKDAKAQQQQN